MRTPFEPFTPGGCHVPNTNLYRLAPGYGVENLAESIAQRIEFEGPETVSAVILEPVQNAGGCFTPPEGYFQRVREICDEYDVLLISDEVICSWGRLGDYFGAERYGYQPDIITTAKGITSAYAPMGAVIASDRVFEPFADGKTSFLHGITFGGHPVAAAVAMANIDVFEHEGILENVREHEGDLRGDARVAARHRDRRRRARRRLLPRASSWSPTATPSTHFTREQSETLIRGYLSAEMYSRGLICRADDRGDPVIQFSPPLIAGPEQFEEIEAVLRPVLEEASRRMLHA